MSGAAASVIYSATLCVSEACESNNAERDCEATHTSAA